MDVLKANYHFYFFHVGIVPDFREKFAHIIQGDGSFPFFPETYKNAVLPYQRHPALVILAVKLIQIHVFCLRMR